MVKVAYVGSHGYHLLTSPTTNIAIAQILPDGRKFFPADAPIANPNLNPGEIMMSNVNSFYNSFQLEIEKKFTDRGAFGGLRYKAALTIGKSIDDNSNNTNTQARNSPSQLLDPMDPKRDRGLSAFDVRKLFVFNFTYDFPRIAPEGFVSKVLNGWQLNGILTLSDGPPVTVLAGFNVSRNKERTVADRPDLAGGASSNPVLGGPDRYFDPNSFVLPVPGFYGNLGRNTLIAPGLSNFDFSLTKQINVPSVSESFSVQFRAEFFNVFNRPNFGIPAVNLFDSRGRNLGSAGRIRDTVTTSREIQFGLKVIF